MYEDLYVFEVHDAVKAGREVMCFDKESVCHYDLQSCTVEDYVKLIHDAERDQTRRYLFYVKKEDDNDSV